MEKNMKERELYIELQRQQENFHVISLGEQMMLLREEGTKAVFLANTASFKAWQLVGQGGFLPLWDRDSVDYGTLDGEEHVENAYRLHAPFRFDVDNFSNGRAVVLWMLHPEGRYYADEDGYGDTGDDEVYVYAVIDRDCNLFMPFRLMDYGQARLVAKGERPVPSRSHRFAVHHNASTDMKGFDGVKIVNIKTNPFKNTERFIARRPKGLWTRILEWIDNLFI